MRLGHHGPAHAKQSVVHLWSINPDFRLLQRQCPSAIFCALGAFILLTLAGCGNNLNQLDAASSDSVAVTSDYPAVAMVILPQGLGLCTGTFVGTNVVLTASHCASSEGDYTVYSSFGTFITSTRHNFGSGSVDDPNDMALLIFSTDVASRDEGQVISIGQPVSPLEHVRLVGFGCNNLDTKEGSGVKRTGTNQVFEIDDYIELVTPDNFAQSKILGASNRAGSCFGDSGGPLLKSNAWGYTVAGIVHAGGENGGNLLSEYINLNREDNYQFLSQAETQYGISLFDPCLASSAPDSLCGSQGASVQIISFLKFVWGELLHGWATLRVWLNL